MISIFGGIVWTILILFEVGALCAYWGEIWGAIWFISLVLTVVFAFTSVSIL